MRESRLRIANAVVSALMLALFVLHGVGNALLLAGVGFPVPKALGYVLLALCGLHVAIGFALTVRTLRAARASRQSGANYPGLNRRFWAVRISGVALAVLIAFHAALFWPRAGAVRLAPFAELELAAHVLFVLALVVHVLASVEPLLVDLGLPATRLRAADVAFVLAIALALMLVAFVVYYLRWSVV